jgi:AraC-like DNA-binding protein
MASTSGTATSSGTAACPATVRSGRNFYMTFATTPPAVSYLQGYRLRVARREAAERERLEREAEQRAAEEERHREWSERARVEQEAHVEAERIAREARDAAMPGLLARL